MAEHVAEQILTAQSASYDEAAERQQKGTRQLLLARMCLFASVYGVSFILARALGSTDYGIYGVVVSQLFWLEMLTHAGVPGATAILIAEGRYNVSAVEASARALLLGESVLMFAICWFLAPHLANFMRIPGGEILFRIAIIDLPFAALYASYDGSLYGHRRFGAVALAQMIYSLLKLAGVVSLLGFGFSIERVLVVTVLSTCGVCAVLVTWYPPRGFQLQLSLVRKIAIMAAPMALYLVSGQLLVNLDLWSLKRLWEGGGEVVGQYVASMNLAKTLGVIPAIQAGVVFTSVAWAVASGELERARWHIQEATRFAVILGVGACVMIGLDASEVLSVIFSGAYAEGDRFLPLQLAGFGLFALLDAFSNSLMAAGRPWFVAAAVVVIIPLAWFSNYILIPWLGPIGAAISMLFATAVSAAVTGVMAYRHFGSLIRCSTFFRVLVAAVIVAVVSTAIPVQGSLVFLKLALLGGLYLLMLHLLGEVTGRDFGLAIKSPAVRSN